jgi:hypothetical protein
MVKERVLLTSDSILVTFPFLIATIVGKDLTPNSFSANSLSTSPLYFATLIVEFAYANFKKSSSIPWQNWHQGA